MQFVKNKWIDYLFRNSYFLHSLQKFVDDVEFSFNKCIVNCFEKLTWRLCYA